MLDPCHAPLTVRGEPRVAEGHWVVLLNGFPRPPELLAAVTEFHVFSFSARMAAAQRFDPELMPDS
jgi:hypothetical protein